MEGLPEVVVGENAYVIQVQVTRGKDDFYQVQASLLFGAY